MVEQASKHGRYQRNVGDGPGVEVGGDGLDVKSFVQEDGGADPRATPQDALAADMVERQAVQPQVAGPQTQAGVGGGSGGIELGVAEQHGARPAFAAAGRNEQGGVGRAGGQ